MAPLLGQIQDGGNLFADPRVFFLGGHSGLTPEAITRTFTVPEGKFLLVPVLVAQIDNIDVIPPLPTPEMIP